MSRITGKIETKAKKSFTLSPETIAFLESMRTTRNAESLSSILEEILQSVRRQHERASVERAVKSYYDSLSGEAASYESASGEFALREFPGEELA